MNKYKKIAYVCIYNSPWKQIEEKKKSFSCIFLLYVSICMYVQMDPHMNMATCVYLYVV